MNSSNYLQTLDSTGISAIEGFQSQPVNLLQSTLIDPSNKILLQSNANQLGNAYSSETNFIETPHENDDITIRQEIMTLTNPKASDDLNMVNNVEGNVSHASLFTNNNSSEKSLSLSLEQNQNCLSSSKDYLGHIFSR